MSASSVKPSVAGTDLPPARAPVASFITEVVGDVGRPSALLQPTADLAHLPGEDGLAVGAKNVIGWRRRGVAHVIDQCLRFGPVHRSQMGPLPYVGVSDPDLLLAIVRNESRVWSAALPWSAIFRGINGESATFDAPVTLDFEPHREARQVLVAGFSPLAMASYVATASDAFERAAEEWCDAGRVDLKSAVRRLLAQVSSRIFIGCGESLEAEVLDGALADVWGGTTALPNTQTHRRAMRSYEHMRQVLMPLVAERRAAPGRDLFSRLCAAATGPDWLDDATLVRLFIGLMAAAFDTTSCGLASMGYLLAVFPEWQERLRHEVTTIGRIRHRRFGPEHAKALPTLDRVWKETLRLFPVAPTLPRTALADVQLGTWKIPANTFVQGLLGPLMRDPAWWTRPDTFDPDRYVEGRAEDRRHRAIFMPFGAGAHACIGMQLATLEVKAFWCAVLSRCRFRLETPYEARHSYAPLGAVSGGVALSIEPLSATN
jgi:cytochrome P450